MTFCNFHATVLKANYRLTSIFPAISEFFNLNLFPEEA